VIKKNFLPQPTISQELKTEVLTLI
jgi:hypothetical protein